MEKRISKSKIEKRIRKKKNPELVGALIKLKKLNPVVAKAFAKPKKKWAQINLNELNSVGKDVIVAGKVLSSGELEKGLRIVAWGASEKAIEKIKKAKGEFVLLSDEIKKNPSLNGLELVK